MPSKLVSDAFDDRLKTWTHIGACPLVDLNEVSDVPKPPFIEIEYPVSEAKIVTPGTRFVNREMGAARFVITVPSLKKGWKAQVLGWADEIADLFRAKFFGGVETFEVSPPVIDERNRDGNRFRVPFVAVYQADTIKGDLA
jgi:hypothetical protein